MRPELTLDRATCDPAFVVADAVAIKFDPTSRAESDARLGTGGHCLRTEEAANDYYASFKLPRTDVRYTLSVGAVPEDASLLAPQVRLLNDRGEVTRSFGAEQFLFRGNRLTLLMQPRADETHLIVLSDHKFVGQKLSRIQERANTTTFTGVAPRAPIFFSMHVGADEVQETTFSFAGAVEIAATPVETKG